MSQTMIVSLTVRVPTFTLMWLGLLGQFCCHWHIKFVCLFRVVVCWYFAVLYTNSADNRFGGACGQKCWDFLLVYYCVKICCPFDIYMNLDYYLRCQVRNLSHLWCLDQVHLSQNIRIHPVSLLHVLLVSLIESCLSLVLCLLQNVWSFTSMAYLSVSCEILVGF